MTSTGRMWAGWILALLAVVPGATQALAQNKSKPAVIVSLGKADKLLSDVGYLTRAAGTPEFGGLVTLMAGPYLQGIDTRRPAGVTLHFAGPQPTGVAFIPVANLNLLVQQLENNSIEVEDAGGGIKKIQLQRAIYFTERNGWVFVSDSAANLADLPENPAAQLGDLPDKYNLAVQVNVRSIDPALIDMAVSEMKATFERTLEAEEDEEKRALQENVGRQSLETVVRFIEESDQLTLGLGVDSQAGKTFLDFSLTAVAGTKLAKQMAGYQNLKSSFAGLEVPDAAATLRFTTPITKEEQDQAREALKAVKEQAIMSIDDDEDLPSDEARRAAKQVVTSLFDVLQATVDAGKLDGGAALLLENESIQVVAGGFVADGKVIEQQLKKLVELAEESDDEVSIEDLEFNVDKHKGVDFHTFLVPIPDDEEEAQDVFGEELEVVVGTGAQSAYLAFGEDSIDLLKKVIDASREKGNAAAAPLELIVSLGPILNFAAAYADEDDETLSILAETLENSNGKDHIRLIQTAIERGISARLEVEEGVLQLIGAAAKARTNQGNN